MKRIVSLLFLLLFAFKASIKAQEYTSVRDSLLDKGNELIFTNKSAAYDCFESLFDHAAEQQDHETKILALQYINYISGYHYDLEKYKRSLDRTDSLFIKIKSFLDTIPDGNSYRISHTYDKGNYYYKTYDFDQSKKAFNSVIQAHLKSTDSLSDFSKLELAQAYTFLASMYESEQKYDLAKEFYFKNLRILQYDFDEVDEQEIHGTNNLLASVYSSEGDFEKANSYLSKSLKFYLNNNKGRFKNNIVTSLFLMAQNYMKLQKLDSAQVCLNQSKKHLLDEDPFLPEFHQISAEIFQENREFSKALSSFQKQLSLVSKSGANLSEHAKVYNKIGELYLDFDQPQKALHQFQNAIQSLSRGFSSSDFYVNPDIDNIENPVWLIPIFGNKAKALNLLKTEIAHTSSLKTTLLGVTLLDSLRTGYKSDSDKLSLIETIFPLFEEGVEAAYQLFETTQEVQFLEQAFYLFEKSKSVLLMEALLKTRATSFSEVPNDILEQEKQLTSKISYLERSLRGNTSDPERQDELFQTKLNYIALVDSIEKTYPRYYDLKYDTSVTDIGGLQNILNPEQLTISYFFTKASLFLISISQKRVDFIRIPRTENLDEEIFQLQALLSNPQSDLIELNTLSLNLYQKILAPALHNTAFSKILIVPDGALNYIPFESFKTNKDEKARYIIQDYALTYANSLSLWMRLQQTQYPNAESLILAPSFEFKQEEVLSSELLPLPHNVKEATTISSHFKGTLFSGKEASLHQFLSNVTNHGIVHLATHAILDDETPEYSYLAFSNYGEDDFLLFLNDLYTLSIEANLVTLSACETGIGDLRKGEGMLSLSRAFFYAGASSIANSLWKINDNATATVMGDFYAQMAKGLDKDTSLRQAKLNFLNTYKETALSHPYYWSGIVLNGNTNPLKKQAGNLWLFLIPVILVVLILVEYMKR